MVAILRPAVKCGALPHSLHRVFLPGILPLSVNAPMRHSAEGPGNSAQEAPDDSRRAYPAQEDLPPHSNVGGLKIPQEPDVCFACHRSSTGHASHRRQSPGVWLVPRSGRHNAASSRHTKDPSPVLRRGA